MNVSDCVELLDVKYTTEYVYHMNKYNQLNIDCMLMDFCCKEKFKAGERKKIIIIKLKKIFASITIDD